MAVAETLRLVSSPMVFLSAPFELVSFGSAKHEKMLPREVIRKDIQALTMTSNVQSEKHMTMCWPSEPAIARPVKFSAVETKLVAAPRTFFLATDLSQSSVFVSPDTATRLDCTTSTRTNWYVSTEVTNVSYTASGREADALSQIAHSMLSFFIYGPEPPKAIIKAMMHEKGMRSATLNLYADDLLRLPLSPTCAMKTFSVRNR
mmetsp:Transcript_20522/g.51991  ORF Transcript_20522/g.51991 Transcript_20522/m.51991 type:complete len:204 (+) Transcript_20522:74-685(+)